MGPKIKHKEAGNGGFFNWSDSQNLKPKGEFLDWNGGPGIAPTTLIVFCIWYIQQYSEKGFIDFISPVK